MASINMESIQRKAEAFLNSSQGKQKISQAVDSRAGLVDSVLSTAASKFIEALQNEVGAYGGKLGPTAISALTQLDYGSPYKVGDNTYKIAVWFTGDMSRESLVPARYDGIDNIVALLNNGYSAGHTVYGVWKGHGTESIASLPSRDGIHFIEKAIRAYTGMQGEGFYIIDIEVVNDAYK